MKQKTQSQTLTQEYPPKFPGEFQENTAETFPGPEAMNVSSATELTGMMYRPPQTDSELESYQNLYDMEYTAGINPGTLPPKQVD